MHRNEDAVEGLEKLPDAESLHSYSPHFVFLTANHLLISSRRQRLLPTAFTMYVVIVDEETLADYIDLS